MNLGIFEFIVQWSELTGCTMDDALMFVGFFWFIFIAVFTFAVSVASDLGMLLFKGAKELFRSIRRRKEKPQP